MTVLCIKHAIVIGPTPPGTGVIFLAIFKTFLNLTSPTSSPLLLALSLVLDSNLLIPTSIIITPVPGGVGPMTIACLMHNTIKAAYINKKNDFVNVLEGIL